MSDHMDSETWGGIYGTLKLRELHTGVKQRNVC